MSFQILKQPRLVKHLLFWVVYFAVGVFSDYSNLEKDCFVEIVFYHLDDTFFGAIMGYLMVYYLLTDEFLKKGYFVFGVVFLASVYLLASLSRLSTVHFVEPLVRKPPFVQESPLEIFTDLRVLAFKYGPSILSASFIFYIAKFFSDYSKDKEKKILLSKEKSDTELKALRAQLNPHFLFNTLNNIYSLSLDSSPKTSSAIGKLSDILDYVLYRCNDDFVVISKEIKLIQDYIELEKLRYDERLEVNVHSSLEIENQVPPLVFLSLVENAFKHGAGEDSGSPKIDINVVSNETHTMFTIVNTFSNKNDNQAKESIGLKNINKQLELLYGNNYSLITKKEDGLFSVTLVLKNKKEDEN